MRPLMALTLSKVFRPRDSFPTVLLKNYRKEANVSKEDSKGCWSGCIGVPVVHDSSSSEAVAGLALHLR